jgi:hypothetical protein
MWIPPEVKEPILLHHPTRASVGYFGAVRLRDGKFVYKSEWDKFDGETFFSFLKYLRRISSHSGRKVITDLLHSTDFYPYVRPWVMGQHVACGSCTGRSPQPWLVIVQGLATSL